MDASKPLSRLCKKHALVDIAEKRRSGWPSKPGIEAFASSTIEQVHWIRY